LDTIEQTLVLSNPPTPAAELTLTINAYGRKLHVPLLIPTVGPEGEPLPDGTEISFDLEAVAIPPDEVEVAGSLLPPKGKK
jgi:hypothetical protein